MIASKEQIANAIVSIAHDSFERKDNAITLKKNVLIAFSGACHSGKTASINYVHGALRRLNLPVKKLTELVRENVTDIDAIRATPNEYVDLQNTVILQKIRQEEDAYACTEKNIWLIDRSIVDSLFYATMYTDVNRLDTVHTHKLMCTIECIVEHLQQHVYDAVFFFEPIQHIYEVDALRPKNIHKLMQLEHTVIGLLVSSLLSKTNIIQVSL